MQGTINIDFNEKTGRFVVHAPFWALELMRRIPNRRFEKKLDNAWTAPALRANVKYLAEAFPTNAVYTDAARVKIQDVMEPQKPAELPFPQDFKFKTEPFEHQMMALHAAYSKPAFALFMDMRTGKTKVTIDLAMAMYAAGLIDRLVLIPLLTLRKNWLRELKIHAFDGAYETHLLDGPGRKFDDFCRPNSGKLKILLTGIESLQIGRAPDLCIEFAGGGRTMTAIDESDSIKNHKALRTNNCFAIRDRSIYRLVLTGTPIAKGPMDFFAQFEFLDPNIFGIGDFYSFRNRYAIMGGYDDKEIIGYQNMQELIEISKPFVYQVRYSDVFKSPPKIEELRTVQLTDEQKVLYKSIKKDGTIRYDGDERKIALVVQNVLEKMLRLQEVCGGYWGERIDTGKFKKVESPAMGQILKPIYKYNHHRIKGARPKIAVVLDVLLREFPDEQGIVWAIHLAELEEIADALREHGSVGLLHGEVDESARAQLDEDFREGRVKWIVANPTTGGRGYTFDAAGVMINYSFNHSYIKRQQSLERATSSKKTKPVVVIDIVVENTVEELILEALASKHDVSEYVRRALEGKKRGVDELLV